nr:hypothetical protein [Tanacetum cinerariifolium]
MDDDIALDEQVHSSDDEDIENAHIPKVNLQQDWWKPLKEDRPATPEPTWSIPSADLPVPTNNWASALASTYTPPPEHSLLVQIGDMAMFMDWFCNDKGSLNLNHKTWKALHLNLLKSSILIEQKLIEHYGHENIEYKKHNVQVVISKGVFEKETFIATDNKVEINLYAGKELAEKKEFRRAKVHIPKHPLNLQDLHRRFRNCASHSQTRASQVDRARMKESLKSVHDAPWGPLPPVVIREPDSRKFQPLPEVQGKGKEKRTPGSTEPSGHAESPSTYTKLGLTNSDSESDEEVPHVVKVGDQDEGQAGLNPGVLTEGQAGSYPGDDVEP